MWLQPRLRPDPVNRSRAQSSRGRHLATRPVRASVWRLLLRLLQQSRLYGRSRCSRAAPFMLAVQTCDPAQFETRLPASNRRARCSQGRFNRAVAHPIGQRQNQLRFEYVSCGKRPRTRPQDQFVSLPLGQFDHCLQASHTDQARAAINWLRYQRNISLAGGQCAWSGKASARAFPRLP